ncbi:hypothetical protein [Haladaptatus caseinilyticus]|uniref:hypothetical protein n=1 Tax=Haladaptatus caseinilyticus TaxID=2993314 RepID=UPI00224A4C1C|nr:hypothetical protein [Haladaptatus caseinilyticus]
MSTACFPARPDGVDAPQSRYRGSHNTYYRATALSEIILEHGVEELLRREWDFNEAYSSTDEESP